MMKANSIKRQVATKGFAHIKLGEGLTLDQFVCDFGDVLFKTLVRENPKSNRSLASNRNVDFHTDHIKAKYILWQCNSQSSMGGESLLLDTRPYLSTISESQKASLSRIAVNCHQLFFGDQTYYPMLSNEQILYYAPFLCVLPGNKSELLSLAGFQNYILSAPKTEIKLSEGDWLIIDNHRMLHARNGFPSGSNRLLTRYWLHSK